MKRIAAVFTAFVLAMAVFGAHAYSAQGPRGGDADEAAMSGGSAEASSSGSGDAQWPGKDEGYIGPNGEGAITGSDFASDEDFVAALEAADGGFENRVETEVAEAPDGSGRYDVGVLSIDFYRTCSEADAHGIVEAHGGVWVRDSYIYKSPEEYAFVTAYFPECGTYEELVALKGEFAEMPEVKSVNLNRYVFKEEEAVGEARDGFREESATRSSAQLYLDTARFRRAWEVVKCDRDVTVAVIDTGFDLDHPDLAANVVMPWDALEGHALTQDHADGIGHGTMVAGCCQLWRAATTG